MKAVRWRRRAGAAALLGVVALLSARAQPLQRFASAGTVPPAPWRATGLPDGKAPLTGMDIVSLDGEPVLRLRTAGSYGVLLHPVAPTGERLGLRWRWRIDHPVAGADLRRKDRDDSAVKVCAMFDYPPDRLGLVDRSLLFLARRVTREPLPAATLCYVADATLPAGTVLANAYTRRMRWMVLDAADAGRWRAHSRDLRADFARAFGGEGGDAAQLVAIAVGADADNTGGSSLAYVADLALEPDPR